MCVRVLVRGSLASDSSETIDVIIITLSIVTASDMVMHHVLIILTLTFIESHMDLIIKIRKCSIISHTVQAIPITVAAKIGLTSAYFVV